MQMQVYFAYLKIQKTEENFQTFCLNRCVYVYFEGGGWGTFNMNPI
jgi:hypothetical protein